jgi:LysR family transcriptional regulator for metE and metH
LQREQVVELRHLKLVRVLAEVGTLTNASKRLYLSQSALSRQLGEIEEELGIPLFKRLKKRMVLTGAGKRVLEGAEAVLGEIRRLEGDIRHMASGETGTLRIAACSHTCFHWLPSVLKSFKQSYPGVEVVIDSSASHDPAGHLLSGAIDLSIVNVRGKEPRISYRKLFDDEMVALVNKHHQWAKKRHVTASDFADQHLINYDLPVEEVVFYQKILMPAGITPKSLTKLPLTDAIVEMVRAGMGVAVLNLWSVRPYLKSRELRGIRVTKTGFKRTWYAAVIRDTHHPPYLERFITYLAHQANP